MGELIRIENAGDLVPIENGVREDSIRGITQAHYFNPQKLVIMGRRHPYNLNLLVVLEGNNSACVADALNEERQSALDLYMWVAESEVDFPPFNFGVGFRESGSMDVGCISKLYCQVKSRLDDEEMMVDSVRQLRRQYEFLRSADTLRRFAGVVT